MDKDKVLKAIARDAMLLCNEHSENKYLSITVREDDIRGYIVEINNDYWNYSGDQKKGISTWFTEDDLMNM
jgi:hypothetical protein